VSVKERPILFSGEMVRAILRGAKTQTRRAMKPQPMTVANPGMGADEVFGWHKSQPIKSMPFGMHAFRHDVESQCLLVSECPFGQPGDRLWVRETWACDSTINDGHPVEYRATWKCERDFPGVRCEHGPSRWKPSIHMPRWASRLTLEVTGVRVERLRDISEEDARAEGCSRKYDYDGDLTHTAPDDFSQLWTRTYGDGSWPANPWVWVVTFRPVAAGGEGAR
jgi:hypothetical protein